MKELKACPFKSCENTDILVRPYQRGIDSYMYFAYCSECGARGPYMETEEQAIDAWNLRNK